MKIDIPDDDMRDLRVIDIRPMASWVGTMGIEELCAHRGIDLRPVVAGTGVFVDPNLGYLITNKKLIPKVAQTFDLDADALATRTYRNWHARLLGDDKILQSLSDTPWYVENANGWPVLRGNCVTVAVIDDGNDRHQLKRGIADFATCRGIDMEKPWSIDGHGSSCAMAIAEPDSGGKRRSPAPDCRILSAQAVRGNSGTHIWFIDLLLMLSWAIGCRGAQIVNMSFTLDSNDVQQDGRPDLLSRIARNLRDRNRALIFASVDDKNLAVGYPASLKGITAVSSYTQDNAGVLTIAMGSDIDWKTKLGEEELLFAPYGICVSDKAIFPGSSGACAYVSGVAALHVEQYFGQPKMGGGSYTLDDIGKQLGQNLNFGNTGIAATKVQGIRLHP